MALTVTITSAAVSSTQSYTITGEVSGVVAPLDELGHRVNGDPETTDTPALGVFSFAVTLRDGWNTVAVRAKKGATEVTTALQVRVPDTFRGMATAESLIRLLPRSLAEIV